MEYSITIITCMSVEKFPELTAVSQQNGNRIEPVHEISNNVAF